ncbi:hypothetical protein, partial [Chitiniphilus shinanonensis]|uniref:hypothetical protein n=1 Tax=Chitiniphilus shinanonensis TaxID=553088 RepID=UPI003340D4F9
GGPLVFKDPEGLNPVAGCIAGVWAGPLGCGVGAAVGTAVVGGIALMTILSTSGDSAKQETCPPDTKDPCLEMQKKIRDIAEKLKSKKKQLIENKYDLYNRAHSSNPGGDLAGKGTWLGHIDQINGLKVGLARKIEEAKNMGCPIPSDVLVLLNDPVPNAP